MAKSKNHTSKTDNYKAHRNGIKKIPKSRTMSTKGMCPKFLLNRKHAVLGKKLSGNDKAARVEKQKADHARAEHAKAAKSEQAKKDYAAEKAKETMSKAKKGKE